MPKFKPKKFLIRVLGGKSRNKEDAMDYLTTGFQRFLLGTHSHANIREVDDDCDSMISVLTMETIDNQPGTGRFLDTYIFQPMGRRIERLAMRFTIASLHPERIAQYIGNNYIQLGSVLVTRRHQITLHGSIADLCSWTPNGSTVVAGMKGLVKQTQSNSIDKSASALAALIRVSLNLFCSDIFLSFSRIEPIFHLETLAVSPDKKWFLLLVKLARVSVILAQRPYEERSFHPLFCDEVNQIQPSPEIAYNLNHRLTQLLRAYRLYGFDSPEYTIGEACAICAEAVSTCLYDNARGDDYIHILQTVYFTIIFILRLIHELADLARVTANRQIYMVLRTLACWMDAIVYRCLNCLNVQSEGFDMDILEDFIAFRSVALADDGHMLPESYKFAHDIQLFLTLPRRHLEGAERCEEVPAIQSLLEAAKQRSERLLRSFSELEREARGCVLSQDTGFDSQDPLPHWSDFYDFGDVWWDHWTRTLSRARRVQVPENYLTEESNEARRIGLCRDPEDEEDTDALFDGWAPYELRRLLRHRWGQYLRSNMDWDWDLGSCMKRLFKLEKQTRVGPSPDMQTPPASSSGIDVDAGTEGTLKISMGEAQGSLPREVKVAYKTATGETHYLTFTQPSIPGHLSISESSCIAEPSVLRSVGVKQDSWCRTGSSDGEREVQYLETGASSSVVSHFKEAEDTSVEESHNGYEGKDVVFDEVQVGGDAMSICSLD